MTKSSDFQGIFPQYSLSQKRIRTFQTGFKGVVQEGVEVIVNSLTVTKFLDFSIQLDSNLGYNKYWVPAKRPNSTRQNRGLTEV